MSARATRGILRLGTVVLLGFATAARAQSRPAPEFQLEEQNGAVLTVTPPDGWALYAPRLPGGTPPEAGLALEVRRDPGGQVLTLTGPEPLVEVTDAGRVRVYRERTLLRLPPLPPTVEAIEVRWAICRSDLCIPGRTRLTRPPGREAQRPLHRRAGSIGAPGHPPGPSSRTPDVVSLSRVSSMRRRSENPREEEPEEAAERK